MVSRKTLKGLSTGGGYTSLKLQAAEKSRLTITNCRLSIFNNVFSTTFVIHFVSLLIVKHLLG